MNPTNGHANISEAKPPNGQDPNTRLASPVSSLKRQLAEDELRHIFTELAIPFDPHVVEWRVTNTMKNGKPRGQVMPYADQRAYIDRLNALLTPAGWTRQYEVRASSNFQRGADNKTVAKVFVTCNLTLFGIGSHCATGEEWADDENAVTSAEAQAFKRTCSCLGLGRYLYHFVGEWVDLDDRRRPKKNPELPAWATPDGWRQGLRPPQQTNSASPNKALSQAQRKPAGRYVPAAELVQAIEALAKPLGYGLYRGLLRTVGRAWKPRQIKDRLVLEKVLRHMQAAQRGLNRLDKAVETTGLAALPPILASLEIQRLDKIDNLKTLHAVVSAVEAKAGIAPPTD